MSSDLKRALERIVSRLSILSDGRRQSLLAAIPHLNDAQIKTLYDSLMDLFHGVCETHLITAALLQELGDMKTADPEAQRQIAARRTEALDLIRRCETTEAAFVADDDDPQT